MIRREKIIQNAYVVNDVDQGVRRFNKLWNIGPFMVRRNFVLEGVTYRGSPSELEISVAYGFAGDLMIELVSQINDASSAFRDAFPKGNEGFHHVAVDMFDHDVQVAEYVAQGFEVATELNTAEGRGASYVDTRPLLGHMIEIYKVNDSLKELYADVKSACDHWNGRNLIIDL